MKANPQCLCRILTIFQEEQSPQSAMALNIAAQVIVGNTFAPIVFAPDAIKPTLVAAFPLSVRAIPQLSKFLRVLPKHMVCKPIEVEDVPTWAGILEQTTPG